MHRWMKQHRKKEDENYKYTGQQNDRGRKTKTIATWMNETTGEEGERQL